MKSAQLLNFILVAFYGTVSMEKNEIIQEMMSSLNVEKFDLLVNMMYEEELDKICDMIVEKMLGKEEKIENVGCDLNPLCTISFTEKKFDFFETEPDELIKVEKYISNKISEKYISNRINDTLLGKEQKFEDSFTENKFNGFETDPDRTDDLQTDPEKKMGKYILKPPKFLFKLNNLHKEKKIEDWKKRDIAYFAEFEYLSGKTDKYMEEFDFDTVFSSPRAYSDSESDWVRFTEKKSDFFEIETDEDETCYKTISKPPKYPYKMDDLKKKMEKNWNIKLNKVKNI